MIDRLRELRHVHYRTELVEFADKYEPTTFGSLEEEYGIVFETTRLMLESSFGGALSDSLQKMMRGELAAPLLDETYRDHFIHPFQDFVLGLIILDYYHSSFRNWYSDALCSVPASDLETCWLLSTIFHDKARPLRVFGRQMEELRGPFIPTGIGYETTYAGLISSAFEHLKSGHRLETWAPSTQAIRSQLSLLLIEHANKGDHGVLGGFALLEQVRRARGSEQRIAPVEIMSALSIVLHNQDPRQDFISNSILPIAMETFPIPGLLLYCDAAQEWGRPQRYSNPETFLVDLDLQPDRVRCEVSFPSDKQLAQKLAEFATVEPAITCSRPTFTYSARVYASR